MARRAGRTAVYPGSFNPPTTAHLAVSEAVRAQHAIDRVVWSISEVALAKETVEHPKFEHRVSVMQEVAAAVDWLEVVVTSAQLMVDIADGFDLLVMGADKWAQINEPHWYGGLAQRDRAMAALPPVAIAPRPPFEVPPHLLLDIEADHHHVSSTRARDGEHHLMLPEARAFGRRTGAWIDPPRYDTWLSRRP